MEAHQPSTFCETDKRIWSLLEKEPNCSNREISRRIGISKTQAQRRAKRIRELLRSEVAENTSYSDGKESLTVKGDVMDVRLDGTRIKTLEELLDYCKVDARVWEVERFVVNKWEVGAVDRSSHTIIVEPLFQVKAVLRKKKDAATLIQVANELVAYVKEEATKLKPPRIVRETASGRESALTVAVEVSVPDIHFGKLVEVAECGEHYDLREAKSIYLAAVENLVSGVLHFDVEEFILPIGNDMFHVDTLANTTTKGTPQDSTGRITTIFTDVFKFLVEEVVYGVLLTYSDSVRIVVVPGNHDELSSFFLGECLSARFHNDDRVIVENQPTSRKYLQYGEVMLMYTHGDGIKRDSLPMIMASERPAMWGTSQFRYAVTGHIHQHTVVDYPGVSVTSIPSLAPSDRWHNKSGYVGQSRFAKATAYHKNMGAVGSSIYNVLVKNKK